jgi:hypothetical protein
MYQRFFSDLPFLYHEPFPVLFDDWLSLSLDNDPCIHNNDFFYRPRFAVRLDSSRDTNGNASLFIIM